MALLPAQEKSLDNDFQVHAKPRASLKDGTPRDNRLFSVCEVRSLFLTGSYLYFCFAHQMFPPCHEVPNKHNVIVVVVWAKCGSSRQRPLGASKARGML